MTPESQLTGGTIATMIVVPLLLLILVAVFFALRSWASRKEAALPDEPRSSSYVADYTYREAVGEIRAARISSWLAPALIAIVAAVTWWGMYPWKSEYHHWVPKSGTVARVDSRLVSDGDKSMQTKFVVMFSGDDQQYGVLDTRAAGVKTGDRMTVTCVRIWQFSGTDGYDCNFVSLERK